MANLSLKLNDAVRFIEKNIQLQMRDQFSARIYITGAPGCGKSDILKEICRKNGWGLVVKYVSNMALEQMTGLPIKTADNDSALWSKPDIFSFETMEVRPEGYQMGVTPTILMLDDFHLTDKVMQKYMFQLLTLFTLNDYKLPKNSAIVLAGNRFEDKAGAIPIPAPVANRLMFIDVHSDAEDWLKNFAIANGVRGDVCTFINKYPTLLSSEPIESGPWASPRAWTYLSKQMDEFGQSLDIDTLRFIAAGLVGNEIASEFILYREVFAKWDIDELFKKDWKDTKNIFKNCVEENILDVYAILNATISWLMDNYKKANFDINKIADEVKFTYDVLAFFTALQVKNATVSPLVIASFKYLNLIKQSALGSAYETLMQSFFTQMKNKRNADWIFYGTLKEIFGSHLSDKEIEKINEAKKNCKVNIDL